jgi:hypothetical protein
VSVRDKRLNGGLRLMRGPSPWLGLAAAGGTPALGSFEQAAQYAHPSSLSLFVGYHHSLTIAILVLN